MPASLSVVIACVSYTSLSATIEGYLPVQQRRDLLDLLFWGSLALSLVIAFAFAFPVNRWLIACGLGQAVVHGSSHH